MFKNEEIFFYISIRKLRKKFDIFFVFTEFAQPLSNYYKFSQEFSYATQKIKNLMKRQK